MSQPISVFITRVCTECSHLPFARPQTLRNHFVKKHFDLFNVHRKSGCREQLPLEYVESETEVDAQELFSCCACYFYTLDHDNLKEHYYQKHKEEDAEKDAPLQEDTKAMFEVSEQSKKTLEALSMRPFLLQSDTEEAMVGYTFDDNTPFLQRQNGKHLKISAMDFSTNNCIHITNDTHSRIDHAIRSSPYKNMLAFSTYHGITQEELTALNSKWVGDEGWIYARLLAGSILTDDKQAILLNGVEIYNRDPTLDAHCEKASTMANSSIPTLLSQYPNQLQITKVRHDNSEKLLLGTQTCNFLVVSSIRVDSSIFGAEVGPSTKNFTPTRACRLYLSRPQEQSKIVNSTMEPLYKIRQLRSYHHIPSTYCFGRSFSIYTSSVQLQPYTVYTLKYSPFLKQNSDSILGSKLLSLVATTVLSAASNPQLSKASLSELLIDKPTTFKNQANLQKMLKLFKDSDFIDIYGNKELADILSNVALITTPHIKSANDTVATHIFEFFQNFERGKVVQWSRNLVELQPILADFG
ncbi:hypothetical protein MBANPS3_004597 [Mucor bainieri]